MLDTLMNYKPIILVGLFATIIAGIMINRMHLAVILGGMLILIVIMALMMRTGDFPIGPYLLAVSFAAISTPIFRGLTITDVIVIILVMMNLNHFLATIPKKLLSDPIIFGVMLYILSAIIGDFLNGFYSGLELYIDVIRWSLNLLYYLYARSLFIGGNRRLLNAMALGFATVVLLSTIVSLYEFNVGKTYDFRALIQPQSTYAFVRNQLGVYDGAYIRPSGLFNNSNNTAMQMAFLLPWCIAGLMESKENLRIKLFYLISMFAVLFSSLLTISRGGILTMICMIIAFFSLIRQKRKFISWGILIIMVLLILSNTGLIQMDITQNIMNRFNKVGSDDFNTFGRMELNELSLKIWLENPFFGVGMGQYDERLYARPDLSPRMRMEMDLKGKGIANHNSYTQFLAESGLIGTLGILFALIGGLNYTLHILKLRQRYPEIYLWGVALLVSSLAILVGSLFSDAIPQRNVWLLFGISSGLSASFSKKERTLLANELQTPMTQEPRTG